jgi:hypothetical protein
MAGQQIQHALLALDMAFVQRLVLNVVVWRCGIGLAHGSQRGKCHASDDFSFSRSKAWIRGSRYSRHTRRMSPT